MASRDELIHEGTRAEIEALNSRIAPSLGFYAVVLLVAVLAPSAAAFGFLAIAVLAVARG